MAKRHIIGHAGAPGIRTWPEKAHAPLSQNASSILSSFFFSFSLFVFPFSGALPFHSNFSALISGHSLVVLVL
jgi:hypothetical protein